MGTKTRLIQAYVDARISALEGERKIHDLGKAARQAHGHQQEIREKDAELHGALTELAALAILLEEEDPNV